MTKMTVTPGISWLHKQTKSSSPDDARKFTRSVVQSVHARLLSWLYVQNFLSTTPKSAQRDVPLRVQILNGEIQLFTLQGNKIWIEVLTLLTCC